MNIRKKRREEARTEGGGWVGEAIWRRVRKSSEGGRARTGRAARRHKPPTTPTWRKPESTRRKRAVEKTRSARGEKTKSSMVKTTSRGTVGSADGKAHEPHKAERVAGTGRYEAKSASDDAAGTPVR